MTSPKKLLGAIPLAMINIIAIDNLRALPQGAQLGLSLVTYYFFATILFFAPVALVSTVFATHYPEKGGIYVWIKKSLGKRSALLVIWIQWIYNVVWYPTQMTFVASTLAMLFDPTLANKAYYLVPTMLVLFWFFTYLNAMGMKWSSNISTWGALLGTLLPISLIILLGLYWFFTEPNQYAIELSWSQLIPEWRTEFMSYMPGIMFGLVGIEVSAYHADEVIEPRKTFPRAILLSSVIIFLSMVLASLAIALIVPHGDIDIITGMSMAFSQVLERSQLPIIQPIITILILLGGCATVATWIIGPSKGVLIAAQDGLAPKMLARTNKHGAPSAVLIIQALVFSALSCFYILVPEEINVVYMLLNALVSQLSLIVYIILFVGYLYSYNTLKNESGYHIPGGHITARVIGYIGILSCLAGMLTAFLIPDIIRGFSYPIYIFALLAGMAIFAIIPFLYILRKTESNAI